MSHQPIVPAQCFAVAVRTGEPSPKEAMKKTLTEAELRQLVAEGKTHRQIGEMTGRFYGNIAAACAVLGIVSPFWKRGRPCTLPAHDLNAYLQDMRAGMTMAEIAAKHGRQESTIVQALRRAGHPTCARKLLRHEAAQQAA